MHSSQFPQSDIIKTFYEKVKKGEVDEVVNMAHEMGIKVSNLTDEQKNFSQTPIFSGCIVKDKDTAYKMVQVLIDLGCNTQREDDLKQTPLYYAVREGNRKLINLLIEKGLMVNHIDKYG